MKSRHAVVGNSCCLRFVRVGVGGGTDGRVRCLHPPLQWYLRCTRFSKLGLPLRVVVIGRRLHSSILEGLEMVKPDINLITNGASCYAGDTFATLVVQHMNYLLVDPPLAVLQCRHCQ